MAEKFWKDIAEKYTKANTKKMNSSFKFVQIGQLKTKVKIEHLSKSDKYYYLYRKSATDGDRFRIMFNNCKDFDLVGFCSSPITSKLTKGHRALLKLKYKKLAKISQY